MTDLTQPGDGHTEPLIRAVRQIRRRCDQLGLLTYEPGEQSAAVPTELCARLARDAAPNQVVDAWPGAAVVRLEVAYRSFEPRTVLVIAVHDRSAETWPGPGPVPASAASIDASELDRIATTLHWMIDDLLESAECRHDIDDLSDQLADAFETLELLYAIGRSMTDLGHPENYIQLVCDRLRETLQYGYVGVHIPATTHVGGDLSGRTLWSGTPGDDHVGGTLDRLVGVLGRLGEVSDSFRGPQAVIRPLTSDQGLAGVILAGDKLTEGGNVNSYDTKLIDAAVGFLSTFLTNSRLYDEQRRLVLGVLESLSAAIDAKDPYTRGHSQRVAWLSQQIALALGQDEDHAERLRIAGLLHDVGKIGVPESVLQKPARLTDDEFEQIKRHPEVGYKILKDLTGLEDILPAVLHHHERIDGRGYPHGLSGEQIPLSAKIVACADAFDAMSSTRSYRQKLPRETVLEEICKSAGQQLDPEVVRAFLSLDLTGFDAMLDDVVPEAA